MRKRPKALVIDDDEGTRFVLTRALAELGFEVVAVDDGADAPQTVVDEAFDLLVADLYMPGMNGFELLRRVRQTDGRILPAPQTASTVPIIVVSGESQPASIANAKRLGADAYLVKPVDIHELAATARAVLPAKLVAPSQKTP
ncbi:MAG: response regulator [Deltaproteobacteria bacterium]|nr:response regulator [Deltaproteobacteria bacterium]